MTEEDSDSTSTDANCLGRTLAGVAWYEEAMKPSYRRNLPQSQRDRLARLIRHIRRENFQKDRSDSIERSAERTDPSDQ